MSSTWQDLHARLLATTIRRSFHLRFRAMATRVPELAPFQDVQDLLQHQHGANASPDARDAVIRAMVALLQGRSDDGELAQHLLLLTLWPGLDAMRWRLRRYWRGDADELHAEIAGGLIVQADKIDLGAVSRVAATILLNLERDLRRAWTRVASRECVTLSFDTTDAPPEAGCAGAVAGPPCYQPDAILDAKLLLARLRELVGGDADLILAVLVGGRSQREAGHALGLTPDAARKRFQRALPKLCALHESF